MAVRSSMKLSETMSVWILASGLVLAVVPGSLAGRLLVDENLETARKVPQISPSPSPVLATSPSPSSSSSPQSWIYVVAFGSVLLVVMALTALAIIFLHYKRKPTAVSPWKSGMSGHLQRPFETTVPFLKLAEVESACEDFSNIIGESSETVVYKGTLASGAEVAATSMKVPAANWNLQLELSFRRKVEALARMKHTHLVNLIAYCSEEEPNFVRMLIFEYASNGTVFDHLHKKESEHLDWLMRMRIVMGAAYGLEYMHHELVPAASHLGFDANSIFLTDDYSAKIANFGVMKMAVAKADTRQKGYWFGPQMVGYEDFDGDSDRFGPDFESNLFSFGVFLLEIVTGRPPHDEVTGHSLVEWASEYLADPKMVWYMVDPSLKSYNHDELVALCRIASLCLSPKNRRPTMRRVVFMLAEVLGITPELAAPKSSALLWAQLELEDEF